MIGSDTILLAFFIGLSRMSNFAIDKLTTAKSAELFLWFFNSVNIKFHVWWTHCQSDWKLKNAQKIQQGHCQVFQIFDEKRVWLTHFNGKIQQD